MARKAFRFTSYVSQIKALSRASAALRTATPPSYLCGTKLYVDRAKLPVANEVEFYYADLIGLRAVTANGSASGKIVSVQNFGAGNLLELKPLEGETEFIPFEDRWVPSVDLEAGMLVIDQPIDDDNDNNAPLTRATR